MTFYIDPQSYSNLSGYDYNLLSPMRGEGVVYFHNVKYQLEQLPCEDCRAVFAYSDKRGVLKALSYAWSLVRILWCALHLRPKVVHIQWFRLFPVDALFVLALRALGAKIVFTAHNVVPHNATTRQRRDRQWYYNHVDAVITHTARSVAELQGEFAVPASKINVIPHGLLPCEVDEATVEARVKELAPLFEGAELVFSALGHQNAYKGIDMLANVWCQQSGLRDNARLRLLVAGRAKGVDLSALRDCKNVVIVDEFLSGLDFDAYLRLSDVAVLPYRAISQCGVLLTALRARVPVLVADVGGLTDPMRYGKVGWVLGEPTEENLAKALLRLAQDAGEIEAVAQDATAFDAVHAAYSWENIAKTTAELYKSL